MSRILSNSTPVHIFGLSDWTAWLDRAARSLFHMSGEEFASAYKNGGIPRVGSAQDLASVLRLIDQLRAKAQPEGR